jgi:hypothetical protein
MKFIKILSGVLKESVDCIPISYWIDVPKGKVWESLIKELEYTISNDLISFWGSYGRYQA